MKILAPLLFIATGSVFLLVATVFYPDISRCLLQLQSQSSWAAPGFWRLDTVLKLIRVIFLAAGAFLCVFGVALLFMKKASPFRPLGP